MEKYPFYKFSKFGRIDSRAGLRFSLSIRTLLVETKNTEKGNNVDWPYVDTQKGNNVDTLLGT
jgi:hypothetical protein